MSISKKLAAFVSAAAVVTSIFVATPANAATLDDLIKSQMTASASRTIDPTTHQVRYYAGEQISFSGKFTLKSSALALVTSSTPVVLDTGFSQVSGSAIEDPYIDLTLTGNVGGAAVETRSSTTTVSKTFASAPTSVRFNLSIYGSATGDTVLAFNPVVSVGGTVLQTSDLDFSYPNGHALEANAFTGGPSRSGVDMEAYKVTSHVGDSGLNLQLPKLCVNMTNLAAGDVLEASMEVSNGTSMVGNYNPWWMVRNAQNMSQGPDEYVSSYTITSAAVTAGNRLFIGGSTQIASPVVGVTYTYSSLKVVKQGNTANLVTSCGTTAATASLTTTDSTVVATLNTTADGMSANSYLCRLYAATDTTHTTAVKSVEAFLWGMNGPLPNPLCTFERVANGTYTLGLLALSYGMSGITEERFFTETVTVVASAAVADTTAPTITGDAAKTVTAGATAVATYTASEAVTWSLSGTNAALFNIAAGVVTFKAAAAAGIYTFNVEATDAANNKGTKAVTVTVTAIAAPEKKAPKFPSLALKVKKGKGLTLALNATKGTAKTAANADGLVTKVTLASSAKGVCTLTPILKSKKITGYTIKGLKVDASKCAVTIAVTGNTTFASVSKTIKVAVTK